MFVANQTPCRGELFCARLLPVEISAILTAAMKLVESLKRVARPRSKDGSSLAAYKLLYKSFAVHGAQTRILHVQPADSFDDDIKCDLKVINLDSPNQEYAALSYSWGDEPRDHAVDCSGVDVAVTKSCVNALRALRQRHEEYVWIDQLCIDQQSLPERGAQVALMSEIFRHASCTYIFLGLLEDLMADIETKFSLEETKPARALWRFAQRVKEVELADIETRPTVLDSFLRRCEDGICITDTAGLWSLLEEWNVCLCILGTRYFCRCKLLSPLDVVRPIKLMPIHVIH